MATLTIRNLQPSVVKSLKSLARKNRRSMESEVRELLEEHVVDRASTMAEIEAGWAAQSRRPSAQQVEKWIGAGRE